MSTLKRSVVFRWVEAISVVFVLGAAVYGYFSLRHPPQLGDVPVVVADVPAEKKVVPVPVAVDEGFTRLVADRDLFNPPPPPPPPPKPVETAAKPVEKPRDLEILPEHLKVVAVAVDKALQLVIEDRKLKKTFFIEQGPEKDGFRIDRVEGRRIFLSYYGTSYIIPFGR